jgi:hypothetical protein
MSVDEKRCKNGLCPKKTFYFDSIRKLVVCWTKYIETMGDYAENDTGL